MDCIQTEKQLMRERQREDRLNRLLPNAFVRYGVSKFDKNVVAFSGGTDSTVMLYLMTQGIYKHKPLISYIDYIVYNNTLMENRETMNYVKLVTETFGVSDKLRVLRPKQTRRQLEKVIIEDFINNQKIKYNKRNYVCCKLAKDDPMFTFLKKENLNNNQTLIHTGVRMNDSDGRLNVGIQLVSNGYIYDMRFYKTNARSIQPIKFLRNTVKQKLLTKMSTDFEIPLPVKSGCVICPIFYRFASKAEKSGTRFKKCEKFFLENLPNDPL